MKTVLIVGGGFSGTMVAAHLARAGYGKSVILVDRADRIGQGLAYSTQQDNHLLNVPAARMSAFPEEPLDFVRFLAAQGWDSATRPFAPRRAYGAYLCSILAKAELDGVQTIRSQVKDLRPRGQIFEALLEDGARHEADSLVLAVGNTGVNRPYPLLTTFPPEVYVDNVWADGWSSRFESDDSVLILGTGLTMIDAVISLLDSGHRGPITAVSRRGQVPLSHAPPVEYSAPDWRVSSGLRRLARSIRMEVAKTGEPRAVIDSLRAVTPEIWSGFTNREQSQFLRHLKPYWEPVRHRAAPAALSQIEPALKTGQLMIQKGRIVRFELSGGRPRPIWMHERGREVEGEPYDRVVNCTGYGGESSSAELPVLGGLLGAGTIIPGPHGLGISTDANGICLSKSGSPSAGIYALGALRRGTCWESTAVPELRNQAFALAENIRRSI